MANLSRTRTLFSFTSPRTIEKIIPEIKILIDGFEGKEWNEKIQSKFFESLFNSEFYEGEKMPDDIALAGRDRITRAPKALGFVDLKPKIQLTKAGKRLLSGVRIHDTIAKQLFKFQLSSPYHKFPKGRKYNIRPWLELLRLTHELGEISEKEIAIFFVQMTQHKMFGKIVDKIKAFRKAVYGHKGNRKEFIDQVFTDEIKKIYAEEIKNNKTGTRQSKDASLKKFIKTKKQNHGDYADAFVRYLRATQLITFDKRTFRMIIAPARKPEVEFILKTVPRDAASFKSEGDFKKYLFDPDSLLLLYDNEKLLEERLEQLGVKPRHHDIESLKDLLENTELSITKQAVKETELALKNYKEFDDIIHVFGKIKDKDIPDAPLYLEWNVWRSFVMMNYAKEIRGNFKLDLDGMPLNTALGNLPDIEIDYKEFKMIVEVTMSTGNTQYNMENESVPRHFGKVQLASNVPVYCLFVAPKISEGALAHFFNLNRMNTKAYGGKTRIIPISLAQYIGFITVAKEKGFKDHHTLKNYLDSVIERINTADDEEVWSNHIKDSLSKWVA